MQPGLTPLAYAGRLARTLGIANRTYLLRHVLNVRPHSRERLLFCFASMGLAWLWHRPTALSGVVASCLLGGIAFWFALGPGLNSVRYHRSRRVRLATLVASVFGLIVVMNHLVPWFEAALSKLV